MRDRVEGEGEGWRVRYRVERVSVLSSGFGGEDVRKW